MPVRRLASSVLLGASLAAAQGVPVRTFDAEPIGQPPAGVHLAAFRQDGSGRWTVARTGPLTYLTHMAEPSKTGWSLGLATDEALRHVEVSVRLRMAGGSRAGGVVWRYVDPGTFSAVVLDLARQELAAYRVVDGNRITFEVDDDLELDPEAWHVLKVEQEGARISVSLGGIRVFRDEDRRYDRVGSGQAGLLAAGDAAVWFDDLRIEAKRSR